MQLTLDEIQQQVEGLILRTKSGALRNKLADVNILLMDARISQGRQGPLTPVHAEQLREAADAITASADVDPDFANKLTAIAGIIERS